MRCVLHVGTEKTATTTLQRLFDRERSALGAAGVAYTRSAGVANNWRLAVAAYGDERHDDRSADAGVTDPDSRRLFRTGLIVDLASELERLGAEHDVETVLFSSEHLHSRLTTAPEIEQLARVVADLGVSETRVVIYLRDPVSLAASLHSTVVKHGSTRRVPPPPEQATYYRHLCDHRTSIERWEAAFDQVVPRLFEPDVMVGGSIVTDFLSILGPVSLANSGEVDRPHLNRSLSTAEIEVLSRINEHLPYAIDGRPNPRHADVVATVERHSAGPSYRLPPRMAQRYRDEFTASNEWVRQRFFPDRHYLFAAEHPDYEPDPSPPGYDGLASLVLELFDQAGRRASS